MNRTNKEELEKLILEENKSYAEISKIFGVSDVTIRSKYRQTLKIEECI